MAILTNLAGTDNLVDEFGVALTDDLSTPIQNITTSLACASTLRAGTIERMRALVTYKGAGSLSEYAAARNRVLAALAGAGALSAVTIGAPTMVVHFRHRRN